MEFLVRQIDSKLNKSGMQDSSYATKHLLHPALQFDNASSIYSKHSCTSSTRRDYKSFLSRSNKSEKNSNSSSRATSTASKRSTREFVSSIQLGALRSRRQQQKSREGRRDVPVDIPMPLWMCLGY
ncbi:hypothetical protein BST61_g614 [Cercospora zeina]